MPVFILMKNVIRAFLNEHYVGVEYREATAQAVVGVSCKISTTCGSSTLAKFKYTSR